MALRERLQQQSAGLAPPAGWDPCLCAHRGSPPPKVMFFSPGERGAKGDPGAPGVGLRGEMGPPGIPGRHGVGASG